MLNQNQNRSLAFDDALTIPLSVNQIYAFNTAAAFRKRLPEKDEKLIIDTVSRFSPNGQAHHYVDRLITRDELDKLVLSSEEQQTFCAIASLAGPRGLEGQRAFEESLMRDGFAVPTFTVVTVVAAGFLFVAVAVIAAVELWISVDGTAAS